MTNSKLLLAGLALSIFVSGLFSSCEKKEDTNSGSGTPSATEVSLDKFYDGLYFGNFWDEGYANYYFVLVNCETGYDDDSYLLPAEVGGYVLYIDLWGAISADHTSPVVPEGTYTAHKGRKDGTFDLEHTLTTYNKEHVVDDMFLISDILFSDGTITVKHTAEGYNIVADFTTIEDEHMKFTYNGPMTLQDKSNDEGPEDNHIRQDLNLNVKRVTEQQYDEGAEGVQVHVLRCFDVDRITDNGLYPYGAGTKLQIGLYTEDGAGIAGTYTVGDRQEYKPGTFFAGSWLGLQGVGTFCMQTDEDNNAKYCIIVDGTINITDNNNGTHTIDCDLTDEDGYNVKCTWTGEVEEFKVVESVQTTLTQDVVFNPITCTEIFYLEDYFLTGTDAYTMMLKDEDEVLAIDFCAPVSEDHKVMPTGTFTVSSTREANTVSPGRITVTYAEPTAYIRYEISGSGTEADAADMAPIFSGTMTITDLGTEHSIEFEFYDDFNRNDSSLTPHKISGSWRGTLPAIEDYYEQSAVLKPFRIQRPARR